MFDVRVTESVYLESPFTHFALQFDYCVLVVCSSNSERGLASNIPHVSGLGEPGLTSIRIDYQIHCGSDYLDDNALHLQLSGDLLSEQRRRRHQFI